jgi:hypothetical protein
MKVYIQQVPDANPKAFGRWINADVLTSSLTQWEEDEELWSNLNDYCDEGHHIVAFRINKDQEL